MTSPLQSLIASGTKLWLDSVDPDLVASNRRLGATGATSNPIIVADLLKSGRFDGPMRELFAQKLSDYEVAWRMNDRLVSDAQAVFHEVWQATSGDDGYVSFELDPLLEDPEQGPDQAERVRKYIELGQRWSEGQENRMIKVPATDAGLASLEELAAAGVTLNVTLVFTSRQYRIARDAIWRGIQRRKDRERAKSVYSIFVSRVDVYTKKHVPSLSDEAQGLVGILNAQRIWQENEHFWADKNLPLQQEMIFASTGTKDPGDPPDKYVAALAGDDIQTNPPKTNDQIQELGRTYERRLDQLPSEAIQAEIDAKVDFEALETTLMREGVAKFADPQKELLALVAEKRAALASA